MSPSSMKSLTPEQAALQARRRFLTVWTVVGVLLLLAAFVYFLNIMSLPVSIALWTLVFIFCLAGVVDTLEAKGVPRLWGTALAYLLMAVILAAIVFVMFTPALGMSDQFTELVKNLPSYLSNFMTWVGSLQEKFSFILQNESLTTWLNDAASAIAAAVKELFEGGASGIVAIGSGLVNGIMAICFAVVISFWLLMELPAIDREFRRLVGPNHREGYDLFAITITRVMGGFIRATILQCLIIGAACAVLYFVLGLPSALALAAIAAVANVVPVLGQWIAIVIVAIIGLTVSPMTALIVIVGMTIIQQFVYTFVSPKLMLSSVDIHPVLTLIVLVVGSALGGAMSGISGSIVGMLLAIPAVACMKSLFVYYFEKNTGRQLVAYDGVFFQGTPSDTDEVDPLADALSPADYEKEQELIEKERMERTGRMEPIRVENPSQQMPKLELPFVKRGQTGQLPPISADEEDATKGGAHEAQHQSKK